METRMHTVQITADEILSVLVNYANDLFVSADVLTPALEWGEEGIFTIRYYTKGDLT